MLITVDIKPVYNEIERKLMVNLALFFMQLLIMLITVS
jgi:hypothetical protein